MNLKSLGALKLGALKMEPEDSLRIRFFTAVLAILIMLFLGPWPVFAQGTQRTEEGNPDSDSPQYVPFLGAWPVAPGTQRTEESKETKEQEAAAPEAKEQEQEKEKQEAATPEPEAQGEKTEAQETAAEETPEEPAAVPGSDSRQYVIQPNDLLEIVVWGEPDISRMVQVRPDGRISLPLVQDLRASELTPAELKEQMENRLKEYVDSPNVTVIVEKIQSYKVYVTGEVQKPGGILVEKPITVLQALTLAGGFQEYADESKIRIVRTTGREHLVFEFNYKDVIKGKKAEENIVLRSGDVVIVP